MNVSEKMVDAIPAAVQLTTLDIEIADKDGKEPCLPFNVFCDAVRQGKELGVKEVAIFGGIALGRHIAFLQGEGLAVTVFPSMDEAPFCFEKQSGENSTQRRCLRCLSGCAIRRDGQVQPCIGLPLAMGNLNAAPFREIVEESEIRSDLLAVKNYVKEPCASCGKFPDCFGCRGAAYRLTGDYLAADPLCPCNRGRKITSIPVPAAPYLPHAGRAVYVGRILRMLEKGGDVDAVIQKDCDALREDGTLDESLLIEMMAQAVGAIYGFRRWQKTKGEPLSGVVAGITDFSALQPVCVGDNLLFHVWKRLRFDAFSLLEVTVSRGGETVARGTLKLYEGAV